ncbi:MAG: amino acid adenylation domain-containing protein [Minicystis sp.]
MSRRLYDLLTAQAEKRPDVTAVVMNGARLTYRDLADASDRLARALIEAGCREGDRVCLFVPKSPEAIIGMLGAMKAGASYVPIDTASPAKRVARIVATCEPAVVLATEPGMPLLREVLAIEGIRRPAAIGRIDRPAPPGARPEADFTWAEIEHLSGSPLPRRGAASDAAHILFTSGSTGQPKGVVVNHASVLAFVDWANRYFDMRAGDRTSGHSPFHFDLSTFDIYGTLAVGAELHLVPPEFNLLPHKLAELIRTQALTQWFSVPSALAYMAKFDVVAQGDFPHLKRLLWCGEVLPTPVLIHWMKRLPHVTFTNLYGPTEAAIASSHYTLPRCPTDERAPIPIGTACDGEELLVLDEARNPLPRGEIGHLYIRGAGLSPGYFRDPEKTREAFFAVSPATPGDRIYRTGDLARVGDDGLVYFIGRADTQIKSRGYRIELGEVEAAAHALPSLKECAVVATRTSDFDGDVICCAYVPADGVTVTVARLRRELSELLPAFMLPARWLCFDALPKNQNGKIDRRALKERFDEREASSV